MNNTGKNIFIILGNGFSINFVNVIKKQNEIDLVNLFSKSDKVPWPTKDTDCFLSWKHCPDLWVMGANSYIDTSKSIELIDNLITSMNVYYYYNYDENKLEDVKNSTYYNSYCQLISYLKNLFIYYNNLITEDDLKQYLDNCSGFINYIKSQIKVGNKINIITYNYDIILERLLEKERISYSIAGFNDNPSSQIEIYKPHGSISFVKQLKNIPNTYNAEKDPRDSMTINTADLTISLDNNMMKKSHSINAIIPPAGDSNRITTGWSMQIKKNIDTILKNSSSNDELIIYGLSYGHVDRNEIDKIITSLPSTIDVKYINPYPSSTFDMVLGSVFKNYSHYKSFAMEVKNDTTQKIY